MPDRKIELGRLISSHGTSPVFLQRAAIIAVLAFLFFMTTLLLFYVLQQMMYFILSSAFLVVYIFTMIGWVMQKRNVVSIHENGITYRKFVATWDELKSVSASPDAGITLNKSNGESVTIAKSIAQFDEIAVAIRRRLD